MEPASREGQLIPTTLIPNINTPNHDRDTNSGRGKELQREREETISAAEEFLRIQAQDITLLSTLERQVLAIKELRETIPVNEFSLPSGIYRPDFLPVDKERPLEYIPRERTEFLVDISTDIPMSTFIGNLPQHLIDEWVRRKELQLEEARVKDSSRAVVGDAPSFGFTRADLRVAWVPLSYSEGFPTLPTGIPFWEQLPYEPPEAFMALEVYLTIPTIEKRGVRRLDEVPELLGAAARASGYGHTSGISMESLVGYYDLYYWKDRTKAYDLFRTAHYRKKSEERALQLMDDHYFRSESLLKRLSSYMEDEEEFWSLMTPKVAIDFFKTLTQMQRVSVGLPAAAPASEGPVGRDGLRKGTPTTLEGLMKQLALQDQVGVLGGDLDEASDVEKQQMMEQIRREEEERAQRLLISKTLMDPAMVEKAQALIVAMSQIQNNNQGNQGS